MVLNIRLSKQKNIFNMKIFGKEIKLNTTSKKPIEKTSCANHLAGYKYNYIKRNAAMYGIDLNNSNSRINKHRENV